MTPQRDCVHCICGPSRNKGCSFHHETIFSQVPGPSKKKTPGLVAKGDNINDFGQYIHFIYNKTSLGRMWGGNCTQSCPDRIPGKGHTQEGEGWVRESEGGKGAVYLQ